MTWSTDEPENKAATGPRWGWRRVILGLVAVIVVAAIYNTSHNAELAREMVAIRASGEPTTLEELEAWRPSPPSDQDATQLWLVGAQPVELAIHSSAVLNMAFFSKEEPVPLLGLPWDEIALARQFLQDNAEAMRRLHAAAAKGDTARFPIDPTYTNWLRSAGRCLALEANVCARDSDMRGAAESIWAGLVLSESLKNEPDLLAQSTRARTHAIAIEQLKRIGAANLPPADLLRLQQTLASIDFAGGVKLGLVGARVYGLLAFDDPIAAGFPKEVSIFSWLNRRGDRLNYLTFTRENIAASELPWSEGIAKFESLSKHLTNDVSRWSIITHWMTPHLSMWQAGLARAETLNRLAIVDIAIARYRRLHDRPPEGLKALVPDFLAEISVDPTTGEPFVYRATPEKYLLYTPSKRFPMSGSEPPDAETGVDRALVFRWPTLPEENAVSGGDSAGLPNENNAAQPETVD